MSVDSLQVQLTSAMQRLHQLQRRVDQMAPNVPRVLTQSLAELRRTLEDLNVDQQRLLKHRDLFATSRIEVEQERAKYIQLFDGAPHAYVVTSPRVEIVEANRGAAELLNISQRFLVGKNLSVFLCSERGRMLAEARHLAETGGAADWVLDVRPRERAALRVSAHVVASAGRPEPSLRWVLRRAGESGTRDRNRPN